MSIDERALAGRVEESKDLHSDSMRETHVALDEMVELGHERVASGIDPDEGRQVAQETSRLLSNGVMGGGALAAAGFGAALIALTSSPAFADTNADVQMLQTSAAIENLAIATYQTALTLPFIGGSSALPVVKAFVQTTLKQHMDHVQAFNAACTTLGGKAQTDPDPVLLGVVNKAKPGLTGPAPVVALAIQLETGASETYVAYTGAMSNLNARKVTASIMGIEAQHVAVLLAVQALVAAGHPELITLPPPLAKLPAAAGSVGFPNPFYKTDMARPASEGAVK
jgi:Ferritin-like domain